MTLKEAAIAVRARPVQHLLHCLWHAVRTMPVGTNWNAGLPPAADTAMESTFPNVAGSCSSVGAAVLSAAVKLATGTPLSCTRHRTPSSFQSSVNGSPRWKP